MKFPPRGKIKNFLDLKLSDVVFIMLIIVGILTFMSKINFMLSSVEHDKNYIISISLSILMQQQPLLNKTP